MLCLNMQCVVGYDIYYNVFHMELYLVTFTGAVLICSAMITITIKFPSQMFYQLIVQKVCFLIILHALSIISNTRFN